MNYSFKETINGRMVRRVQTHSIRRFYRRLRTINWEKHLSVYLRISYGKDEDNFGHIQTFYNDGDYDNKSELWQAMKAFVE